MYINFPTIARKALTPGSTPKNSNITLLYVSNETQASYYAIELTSISDQMSTNCRSYDKDYKNFEVLQTEDETTN